MKKILNILSGRLPLITLAVFFQLGWLSLAFWYLGESFTYINIILVTISIIAVISIINSRQNPAFKLSWTVLVMAIPFFGGVLYLFLGHSPLTRHMKERMNMQSMQYLPELAKYRFTKQSFHQANPDDHNQLSYLSDFVGYYAYGHTASEYFPSGELYMKQLYADLRAAKRFIFMEFFIIDHGIVWQTILDILVEKVKEGVEVRLLYDDFGVSTKIPRRYDDELRRLGLHVAVFNPLRPIYVTVQNNRDHRKVVSIDGIIGYTGGINLADEYTNQVSRFGHWKDSGLRLEGQAVSSLTAMFLTMWNVAADDRLALPAYMADESVLEAWNGFHDGWVQPFADSPLDGEAISENVFLNLINHAHHYIYFYTPYLILSNELTTALCLAAKSGVDVRIVTPAIPDKKIVYQITRANYPQLLEAGVKIYEYSPGFIHAKVCICDDHQAMVGSVNLDFRSLYHHFECGVLLHYTECIRQINRDFMETFAVSHRVSLEECDRRHITAKMVQAVFRVFAALF